MLDSRSLNLVSPSKQMLANRDILCLSPTSDGKFGSYSLHLSARCCPRSAGRGPRSWSASSSSLSAAWVVVVAAAVAPPPHFATPFAQLQTPGLGQLGSVSRDGLLGCH